MGKGRSWRVLSHWVSWREKRCQRSWLVSFFLTIVGQAVGIANTAQWPRPMLSPELHTLPDLYSLAKHRLTQEPEHRLLPSLGC